MARSEALVGLVVSAWERQIGRANHLARGGTVTVSEASLLAAVRRMDEVAQEWRALRLGGSISFMWPKHLTFDDSKSARGRRPAKSAGRRNRY